MKKVAIGNSGIEVTELCFGTLTMGKLQANIPPEEGAAAIKRAVDLGVDFVDTAQAYGSYEHIALALKEVDSKNVKIASKSHAKTYQEMQEAVEEACEVLGKDKIEIFHLHLIRSAQDLEERLGALKCLRDYKAKGIVQSIATSVHTIEGLDAIADSDDIEIVLPCINQKGLGINDGTLDEMLSALRKLREKGKGVYCMKPLGGGHLRKQAREALNFVRNLPEVDVLAVGMLTPEEAEANVRIFNDEDIPEHIFNALDKADKKLTIYTRICKGCGNCIERCDQEALTLVDGKPQVDPAKCILCGYCAEECPVFCIRVV